MIEYEVRLRFRTDAEPRTTMEEKDVSRVLVPFLFPRAKAPVTYVGSSLQRVDYIQRTSTRTGTVSETKPPA